MKRAALITLHGMGRTERDYADDVQIELVTCLGTAASRLHFGSIYYQDLLQHNQQRVWKAAQDYDLRWHKLRQFLVYGFGDAAALESHKRGPRSVYIQAQTRIAQALYRAYRARQGDGDRDLPVVLLAHSLGGQVVTNYLWDAQQRHNQRGLWQDPDNHAMLITDKRANNFTENELDFLRGATVRYLYTTGCNIPIFVAGHDPIVPISPPRSDFEWHNFYDPDDSLGWPLGCLSHKYRNLVIDHRINASSGFVGWLFKSWNVLSHGEYWQDKDVLRHLVARLLSLL